MNIVGLPPANCGLTIKALPTGSMVAAAECALGDLKATVHENIAYPHRRGRNNGRHDPGDDGAHK
jgi:hypothetical protein